MVNSRQVLRSLVSASLLAVLSAASLSVAYAQDFTLTTSPLRPPAGIDPGGTATSIINLQPVGSFDGSVLLDCAVTSNQSTTSPPLCVVSPSSQVPPADGPSLTITTTGATPAGTYPIKVTGTSGSSTQTTTLYLNVADLTEDYSLSVTPTTATPSPVSAGIAANTTVTVNPIGSYNGKVTLACQSITPAAVAAPVCSFNPATVTVSSGLAPTSVLTITTFGTAVTTRNRSKTSIFYALCLALPGLALMGVGVTGSRRRKLLGLFLLVAVAGALLLMPACGATNNVNSLTTTNGQITPNNTYTLTLTGADENGAAPGTTTPTTVTLTVN